MPDVHLLLLGDHIKLDLSLTDHKQCPLAKKRILGRTHTRDHSQAHTHTLRCVPKVVTHTPCEFNCSTLREKKQEKHNTSFQTPSSEGPLPPPPFSWLSTQETLTSSCIDRSLVQPTLSLTPSFLTPRGFVLTPRGRGVRGGGQAAHQSRNPGDTRSCWCWWCLSHKEFT